MFRGFLVRGRLCRLSVLSVVFVSLFVSRLYVQNLIIRFGQNENFFDIFSSEEPKKPRFEFFDPTFLDCRLNFSISTSTN